MYRALSVSLCVLASVGTIEIVFHANASTTKTKVSWHANFFLFSSFKLISNPPYCITFVSLSQNISRSWKKVYEIDLTNKNNTGDLM